MTYHVQFLLLVLAGWVNRQQQDVIDYLQEENRVLRAGLRGKRLRLSDDERRRLAVKAQALGREALAQIASVATPAMLVRWYRHLIAAKYDGSKNRSLGRLPTAKDIRELIVRVARENPTWGYTRLRGALKNLGHELGRNTIKRILADHGIAPAPERGRSMSWSTFIKAHWGAFDGCFCCLLLVMCTYPFAKKALTLYLARGEGRERYFGCNLMQRKVLALSHQHLIAEAPSKL